MSDAIKQAALLNEALQWICTIHRPATQDKLALASLRARISDSLNVSALEAMQAQEPAYVGRVFVDQLSGARTAVLSNDCDLPDMTRIYANAAPQPAKQESAPTDQTVKQPFTIDVQTERKAFESWHDSYEGRGKDSQNSAIRFEFYKHCSWVTWQAATHWMKLPSAPVIAPNECEVCGEREAFDTSPLDNKELIWLYTHCRAIGMTCESDSGRIEHDMSLFTVLQKDRIAELEKLLAAPQPAKQSTQPETAEVINHDEAFELACIKLHESNLARCYIDLKTKANSVPEGWQLVPIEPTVEMMDYAFDGISMSESHTEYGVTEHVWAYMLDKAPKP